MINLVKDTSNKTIPNKALDGQTCYRCVRRQVLDRVCLEQPMKLG